MKKLSTIIHECFEVNFLFKNLLIPIAFFTFYCGSFAYLSSKLLINGVNYYFTSRSWKYLLIPLVVLYLILLVNFYVKKSQILSFTKAAVNGHISDLIFLLLPLTTVVQFIINNREILSPLDSYLVLGFFVIFTCFYIYAIPVLFGIFSSTRTLMMIGLAFVVTLINMALLSQNFGWLEKGSLKIQFGLLGVALIVSWILLNVNNQKVLYIVILAYFITNSSFQLLQKNKGEESTSIPVGEITLRQMAEERISVATPNIYLLVYDSYVTSETMLAYGIDNSIHEEYISDQGFVLYPDAYSIGGLTLASMSRVLNASTEFYGSTRRAVSGDGIVQNTLHDLGYTTYGVFPDDYMFQGSGSSYDIYYPDQEVPSHNLLISAILIGEFRFDLGYHKQTYSEFLDAKHNILTNISGNQVFIYSHTKLPNHSQNSGTCLSNEIKLYKERLSRANEEMRQDLGIIIENDPEAIIILAGDHGPYLTKNCQRTSGAYGNYDISEISRLDIQDRFGTFLAIRWPTKEYAMYDDITVLQDLFPAIFAYLYGDIVFLNLKVSPEISDTLETSRISGASVKNGIISGGIDDGEPLFLSDQ